MSKDLRFACYDYRFALEDYSKVTRYLLVIKKGREVIAWTDFHKFIKTGKRVRSINSENRKPYVYVSMFLNYLFFDKCHIKSIKEIEIEMAKDFLNDYGLHHLINDVTNTHRKEVTVNEAQSYIISFLRELTKREKMKFKESDLISKEPYFNKEKRKMMERIVPVFDVLFIPHEGTIVRDTPQKVFEILMNQIIDKHPRLMMIAALCAFAGLRPSEACNVTREGSMIGSGLKFTVVNGMVTKIEINLKKELQLRSDSISVGNIKKERVQLVHPNFILQFMDIYEIYMKFMEGRKYESFYEPLSINSQGKALTYNSYLNEFKQIIKEIVPILLSDTDPIIVEYGYLIKEHGLSPHIFRHWFTVQLVLFGCDAANLMYWRGDSSVQSVEAYLRNKGELEKLYSKTADEAFNYIIWKGNKMYG